MFLKLITINIIEIKVSKYSNITSKMIIFSNSIIIVISIQNYSGPIDPKNFWSLCSAILISPKFK